ncbi:MAG: AAA family ATPase [Gammaproteobacteria bacterium]|nr:AAA family ATPase [Gammaproteobacteria bacterium]
MYQQYFGMQEMPFSLAPDTQFFFCHHGHQEALNVLMVALECGEGFIKITGEVGTGKTLLCRELLNRLSGKYHTAYIPNPFLSPVGLRKALAEELDINPHGLADHDLLKAINQRLLDLYQQGRPVLVCLDEAQALPDQTMETLRLLSNLETEKRKLLQIVLFGQPELDEKLARTRNRQLRQRIVHSYRLQPLDSERVMNYLDHRLRVAGYNGEPLFRRDAADCLYRISGGIPRLINILGNKALLLAFGKGLRQVDASLIRAAAEDTDGVSPVSWFGEQILHIGFALGMLLLALGAWMLWGTSL